MTTIPTRPRRLGAFARRPALLVAAALATIPAAAAAALLLDADVEAAPAPTVAAAPAAALTVETTAPVEVDWPVVVKAGGSVAARDELVVGSDAEGVRLAQVSVELGDRVRRGQLLAHGDDTRLQAARAQLGAALRQAQVEAGLAADNLARAERIADSGVFSDEALQARRSAAQAASARADSAAAALREVDVRIAQTRVLAPADGVVSRRSATVGAVMQPGQELFRLIRDGALEWRAELPDAALAQVQPGQPARLARSGTPAGVDGTVRLVAPTVDAATRQGLALVALPPGAPWKPGQYAEGEIRVAAARARAVPEAALRQRDGRTEVLVVTPDGRSLAVVVRTGQRRDGLVEVQGLAPDARVITKGAGFVKAGESVRVAAAAPGEPS